MFYMANRKELRSQEGRELAAAIMALPSGHSERRHIVADAIRYLEHEFGQDEADAFRALAECSSVSDCGCC
jgi:hypothetical protein